MAGLLTVRDAIRDFLRKYDEITTPIIRFIIALVVFNSINSMYGYSTLFDRGIVIFLLAVISALVSDTVMALLAGAVMCLNAFTVSIEVGALFALVFVLMYCLYMRMFPECSWILILVPVLYTLKLPYAAPVIVAIFVGLPGAVPAAFGIVLYYFSRYTREVYDVLQSPVKDESFQELSHIVKGLVGDKELILAAIVFAIVIVITHTIHRMSFDYSWYVAIGVGALCNIIFFMVCGTILDAQVNAGSVFVGTVVGAIVAFVIQICKSIADYSRKEVVQFEDDEYYYYVKAIPKLGVPSKSKSVKTMTSGASDEESGQRTAAAKRAAAQARQAQARQAQARQTQTRQPVQGANRQGVNRPSADNRRS